ncbi:MAG: glycerol-3-phosphate 1-O-acyltransferase PlsY [Candidatus Improbicoccus pseudotrichonymphae]|uniref:Glycerol-3-phosphate acyltransferase n=1 Tax=Candidatus Improbicoccus pseudotrichonymphae TaxID=3033792 RepID=A0AA48KVD3_9FIRM|nr:MAG: glycerol-3-phosphate 1-O-acyltransferase PlsY [Candidatus Improbicoccus pseudotrichonymphae]
MIDFLSKHILIFLLILVFSYLSGSLNFAIIISKFVRHDIRNFGSKNAGFSNVVRSFGKIPGIITFFGDFLKGILAVSLSKVVLSKFIFDDKILIFYLYFSFLSCFLGHLYPCYFGFKGGKGILTAWSMSFLIDWRISLILISTFLIMVLVFRIVSLASIIVALAYPIVTCLLNFHDKNLLAFSFIFSSLISVGIILKHVPNIKKLLRGEEEKINIKKR